MRVVDRVNFEDCRPWGGKKSKFSTRKPLVEFGTQVSLDQRPTSRRRRRSGVLAPFEVTNHSRGEKRTPTAQQHARHRARRPYPLSTGSLALRPPPHLTQVYLSADMTGGEDSAVMASIKNTQVRGRIKLGVTVNALTYGRLAGGKEGSDLRIDAILAMGSRDLLRCCSGIPSSQFTLKQLGRQRHVLCGEITEGIEQIARSTGFQLPTSKVGVISYERFPTARPLLVALVMATDALPTQVTMIRISFISDHPCQSSHHLTLFNRDEKIRCLARVLRRRCRMTGEREAGAGDKNKWA
ncbi:hypothetical protein BJV74DRAFT_799148 [Russula compacta]|nr:hypothetical protein BJV74DRAFT_799148 [Russula compacta]